MPRSATVLAPTCPRPCPGPGCALSCPVRTHTKHHARCASPAPRPTTEAPPPRAALSPSLLTPPRARRQKQAKKKTRQTRHRCNRLPRHSNTHTAKQTSQHSLTAPPVVRPADADVAGSACCGTSRASCPQPVQTDRRRRRSHRRGRGCHHDRGRRETSYCQEAWSTGSWRALSTRGT